MEFILVHQISKKGREDIPHLIAVKEIVSIAEIDGVVHIQLERDQKGRIRIGISVRESMWEISEQIKTSS